MQACLLKCVGVWHQHFVSLRSVTEMICLSQYKRHYNNSGVIILTHEHFSVVQRRRLQLTTENGLSFVTV